MAASFVILLSAQPERRGVWPFLGLVAKVVLMVVVLVGLVSHYSRIINAVITRLNCARKRKGAETSILLSVISLVKAR